MKYPGYAKDRYATLDAFKASVCCRPKHKPASTLDPEDDFELRYDLRPKPGDGLC